MSNNLKDLSAAGVSIWLDDLSRGAISSGALERNIAERSVVGVTTNPTIFATALAKGADYAEQMSALAEAGASLDDAVAAATTDDVRDACDILRPVFDATGGYDGRVSIEVDPRLAHETDPSVEQARALWMTVDRPNVLIKIPATLEGLPAVTTVIGEGISVNVTLIFSIDRYWAVMEAYLAGLEAAHAAGIELSTIHSVASFFVSRIDTETDKRLDAIGTDDALALRGRAAVANARLAYEAYLEFFESDRFKALPGANRQRALWASTGTKNPAYSDVLYVAELIASGVVNTMPGATLEACSDHLEVTGDTITPNIPDARATMDALAAVGIDFDDVTDLLEKEGVEKFEISWEELLQSVSTALRG
ncbi:MAG: transaldolase [Actinomycetota bacterium]